MIETDRFEKIPIDSPEALRKWLSENCERTDSVWLVTWKKHTGAKYVSTSQILDELLSFGWIDGIRRKLDDDRTMQLVSQRKVLHWAATYKDRAERLIAEGRMQPSGQAKVDESIDAGEWNTMTDVDSLEVPEDLATALLEAQPALENFNESAPSYRRNLLRWLKLAKKQETRAKRIAAIVDYTRRNERMPQM